MAVYTALPENYAQLNEAQQNDAARAAGYTGREDAANNANLIRQGGGGTNVQITAPGAAGVDTSSADIVNTQKELDAKLKAKNDAIAVQNDNPFYVEATRVGQIAKINDASEAELTRLQNKLNTLKQDAQQKAEMALKVKEFEQANTKQINYDDGVNQGVATIDAQTGKIISKTIIASTKPATPKEPSQNEQQQYYKDLAVQAARGGLTLSQMFQKFRSFMDADTIYQLYNANSKYGPDKGPISALAAYGVTQKAALSPTDAYFQSLQK